MDLNSAMDLIASFDDAEVLEGLMALEKMGSSRQIDIVRDLTQHENPRVREEAERVMQKLLGKSEMGNPSSRDSVAPRGADTLHPTGGASAASGAIRARQVPRPGEGPFSGMRQPASGMRQPMPEPAQTPPGGTAHSQPGPPDHPESRGQAEAPPGDRLSRIDDFIDGIDRPVDLPDLSRLREAGLLVTPAESRMTESRSRIGRGEQARATAESETSPDGFAATGNGEPEHLESNEDQEAGATRFDPSDFDPAEFNKSEEADQHLPAVGVKSTPEPDREAPGAESRSRETLSRPETRSRRESRPQGDEKRPPGGRQPNGNLASDMARGLPAMLPPHPSRFSDNMIDNILLGGVKRGASDIHVFADHPPMYRIHGEMYFEDSMPISGGTVKQAVREMLGEMEYQRFVEEMEVDMAYHIQDTARFRVNVFNDINGIGMVFRHIPDKVPSMEDLKLPPVFKEMCCERKGLILVTGPTGSGKSTTIAAMVDWINKNRRAHILTIEDPVEFVHRPMLCKVTHRQVKKNTATFTSALKNALRQDPDVIVIGELRDLETVAIALHAAETGHLVLGTLHTKNASRTVDRLVGIFPTREQDHVRNLLADGLRGVIAQTLIRRRDGNGRVGAYEIMVPNPAISNMIRKGGFSQINDSIRSGRSQGMQSFVGAIYDLIKSRMVTMEEALPHLISQEEKDELRELVKGK